MKALAAGLLALAACTPAPQPLAPEALQTYPDARGMPADVQAYIVQWQDCAHWLGEPDWDEARRRQIEAAVRETCPGVDEKGRRVRVRHAANQEVIGRLRDYGPLNQ